MLVQVLREGFSLNNGMILPGGNLHRRVVLRRHRHIIDSMYRTDARTNRGGQQSEGPNSPRRSAQGRRRGRPPLQADISGNKEMAQVARQLTELDDRLHQVLEDAQKNDRSIFSPGMAASALRSRQSGAWVTGTSFSSLGKPFSLEDSGSNNYSQGSLDQTLGNYFQHSDASTPIGSPRDRLDIRTPRDSPRQFGNISAQNSPRKHYYSDSKELKSARKPPPRSDKRWSIARSHDWQEKFPSVAGSPPKVQRGRYSPSFTVQSARPWDKEVIPKGDVAPADSGFTGLSLGSANFDGFAYMCMPQSVHPPAETSIHAASVTHLQLSPGQPLAAGSSPDNANVERSWAVGERPFSVLRQSGASTLENSPPQIFESAPGEWAF